MQEHTVPIAIPPWKKLGKKLESTVRKALYDYKMLHGVSKLAVALSGGKDSLTMLFLLKAILGHGFPNIDLCAIHVSGPFSCGAGVHEHSLKSICDTLSVPLTICEMNEPGKNLTCYSCSRDRRKLIFDRAKDFGAQTIAFGHHRDDSAQTLIMNLLHKGEFVGILPKIEMVDFSVTIIRPLILVNEVDIRQFAKNYNFSRITCQCPVGQNSMRKKTDNLILEMEFLFPNARSNIASAVRKYGSDKAIKKRENT